MDNKQVIDAITKLKSEGKKRNFIQSYDFIVTLKGLDTKKPEGKIDFYAALHNKKGKKSKLAAFVGPELLTDAKKAFDTVITTEDFSKYSDKKAMKKLANEHDFFISQANIMNQVATQFGKVLGIRGKMPNPKAGCVVPPKGANLEALYEKLQKTARITNKTSMMVQATIGSEDMPDEAIAANAVDIYKQLLHNLPNQDNNVSKALIKLTMSKPVEIAK